MLFAKIVAGKIFFFFFSSRRRHTRCSRDWSSDVCSSDLLVCRGAAGQHKEKSPVPRAQRDGTGLDVRPGHQVEGGEPERGGYVQHVEDRSEERRVGEEGRSRWSPYH